MARFFKVYRQFSAISIKATKLQPSNDGGTKQSKNSRRKMQLTFVYLANVGCFRSGWPSMKAESKPRFFHALPCIVPITNLFGSRERERRRKEKKKNERVAPLVLCIETLSSRIFSLRIRRRILFSRILTLDSPFFSSQVCEWRSEFLCFFYLVFSFSV